MPWKYNGKNIQIGKSWTSSDNVVHPSNWGIWSDDYKKSVGLTFEKEVDNSFDDRFYWSKGNAKSLTDKKEVDEETGEVTELTANEFNKKTYYKLNNFSIIYHLLLNFHQI